MNSPLFYLNMWLIAALLTGCCHYDPNREVKRYLSKKAPFQESPYFLVILVDARQLDYTSSQKCVRSIAKHPSDGSKNSDVGHAWIYLQGVKNGALVKLEGGHSGEQGRGRPKYFEGIMNYFEYGAACPNEKDLTHSCYEPNPIKYLWEPLDDGFFEKGSGGHIPTFAIKVDLTPKQFDEILLFIKNYPFEFYSLTSHQCCTFVVEVAALAHLHLDSKLNVFIDPNIVVGGVRIRLWTDAEYSTLELPCPEMLEYSMLLAVNDGRAECALPWYLQNNKNPSKDYDFKWDTLKCFPERLRRLREFSAK